MADILATQGKDAECEFVLVRCVREHPRFVPAYNGLAELQMRHGRVSQAAKVLSWALRINPRDPVLLNNFGMCWLIQRDYEKALVYFTRAAEMAPRNARYQANVAVAQGLMGRYDDSLSSLTRVMPEDQAKHNLQVLREAGKDAGTGKVVTN
ncbi:MAG: tetratricopeptide repeat protein [Phycisphaerales bacterium]|nr:MAG: tetratricopeptide repeat protein [Phycisphaerales bacterium]